MAWDVLKGRSTDKDYGRSQPPPADSHEWAGVAPSAAEAIVREARKKSATPAAKVTTRASVGAEGEKKDKKPWLFAICGFVAGLITGSWGKGNE